MKKWIALCLALLIALMSTGCSKVEDIVVGAAKQIVEQSEKQDEAPEAAQPTKKPQATEEPQPTAEPQPEQTTAGKTFSHGTWSGNTFTSEFAGLTFRLPEGDWHIADDAELAEIMELGLETNDMNMLEEAMVKLTTITDMMASNDQTGESVVLMYENLAINPAAAGLTVDDYAGILEEGVKNNQALNYVVGARDSAVVCDQEYLGVNASVEAYSLHQKYLIRYEEGMMVSIILTAFSQERINELLGQFGEQPQAESLSDKPALDMGTWNGNVYTNEFAQITLELVGDGWEIKSKEQIAKDAGITVPEGSSIEDELSQQSFTDIMVADQGMDGALISISYINFDSVGNEPYDEEVYLQALRASYAEDPDEDFPYEVSETKKINLCGNEYLYIDTVIEEYSIYDRFLACNQDGKMVVLLVCSFGEDHMQQIMDMFK